MGKATRKKQPARRSNPVESILGPTEARLAHNDAERMGLAYRMVPMIETLLRTKQITQREFDALNYYRDQASRAEDDMAQEGTLAPSRIMGGSGGASAGKIPATMLSTPAILAAIRLGTCSIRLPSGHRCIVISGRIVTVEPKIRAKCRSGKPKT